MNCYPREDSLLLDSSVMTVATGQSSLVFNISPIIRITLLSLYIALTLPLPFLAAIAPVQVPISLFISGLIIGFVLLWGALSQKVILDDEKIAVTYPVWFPSFLQKGWSLSWREIEQLKLRTTGQGGLVYYFITSERDRAYLLPTRVAGFAKLVKVVEDKTGIDTRDVRPLAQPWMYFILFGFTLLLSLVDAWTIWTAVNN